MMLREWTGPAGDVTRDYVRFEIPYVVAEPASPTVTEPVAAEQPQPSTPGIDGVSVNTATAEELVRVKGIGRTLAAEIIKRRPYESLDGLLAVRGIGPKQLTRLRPYLTC
jgi:DNA uptake protein ComE-like DNA-binding protein